MYKILLNYFTFCEKYDNKVIICQVKYIVIVKLLFVLLFSIQFKYENTLNSAYMCYYFTEMS